VPWLISEGLMWFIRWWKGEDNVENTMIR
jgi:hypothetical protein